MSNNAAYGIITEQGDLGLGYNPLNKEETKAVLESVEREKSEKETED